jgi:hypothetical protein
VRVVLDLCCKYQWTYLRTRKCKSLRSIKVIPKQIIAITQWSKQQSALLIFANGHHVLHPFLNVKQGHSEKNDTNRSPYMEQGDWGAICRADGAGDNTTTTSLPSRLMSGANNMQKSCGNGYAIAGECAAIIGLNQDAHTTSAI